MRILTNESLIRRNARIAQAASLAGLVVLIGGMVISFTREDLINWAFIALLVGFIFSQIGMYFTNRWGRRPRPDEHLNRALKGLDNKYALYHYLTPVAHLLVGPAGIWVLQTKHQRGTVTYSKGRWRLTGGGMWQAYLKIFGQEGLGRPDIELENESDRARKYLADKLAGNGEVGGDLTVQAALVFTHEDANIHIEEQEDPPAPTLLVGKLKDYLRKTAKTKPVSLDMVQEIQASLPQE